MSRMLLRQKIEQYGNQCNDGKHDWNGNAAMAKNDGVTSSGFWVRTGRNRS